MTPRGIVAWPLLEGMSKTAAWARAESSFTTSRMMLISLRVEESVAEPG